MAIVAQWQSTGGYNQLSGVIFTVIASFVFFSLLLVVLCII